MLANPKKTKDDIVQWIRNYFSANGNECAAVVGISGGKDSSIVAALCVEALGKDRVLGVLMPNGEQSDISDSFDLVSHLGISSKVINIGDTVFALADSIGTVMRTSEQMRVNLPARIRMATLYAVAQSIPEGGRVANTCNMSEDFVGYSTKFGDSAGDFSPLSNLMVHEVKQIGYALGLPSTFVEKVPSDGLCGKSDEDNLGFSYAEIDDYIMFGSSGKEDVDRRIQDLHNRNLHKLSPMPAFTPERGGDGIG